VDFKFERRINGIWNEVWEPSDEKLPIAANMDKSVAAVLDGSWFYNSYSKVLGI